jgi:hypothetical protein
VVERRVHRFYRQENWKQSPPAIDRRQNPVRVIQANVSPTSASLDVARQIQKLVPGTTLPTNRRPDLTIAATMLPGWTAEIHHEQGVRRTWEWLRAEFADGVGPVKPPEPLFTIKPPISSRIGTRG